MMIVLRQLHFHIYYLFVGQIRKMPNTLSDFTERKLNRRHGGVSIGWIMKVSCGVRDKIKENHLSLSSNDVVKGDLRINST
jgi:hypothetical protein